MWRSHIWRFTRLCRRGKSGGNSAEETAPKKQIMANSDQLSEKEIDALYDDLFAREDEPGAKDEMIELQNKYNRHIAGPSVRFGLSGKVVLLGSGSQSFALQLGTSLSYVQSLSGPWAYIASIEIGAEFF